MYPNEAHIFMDVKNGYDIYYDPHYEPAHDYSHYDRMYLGEHYAHDYRANETPMYVRPYLEDPIWLEPDDDEIALLHNKKTSSKHKDHHYFHDLPGDPDLENPDDEEHDDYDDYIIDAHHRRNETPMYVRPYLEDPVWLQPDDDEMQQLHPSKAAKATHGRSHHHLMHDLHGDPDLENPDDEEDLDEDDSEIETDSDDEDYYVN